MKGSRILGLGFVPRMTACLCVLGVATAASAWPTHLVKADALVNDIDAQAASGIVLNDYGAPVGGAVVLFKGEIGGAKVFAECSTFVTKLLGKCYGWNWSTWNGGATSSPTAALYHDYILAGSSRGFTTIPSLWNCQAGDILACRYSVPNPSTGHVMIFRGMESTPYTFQYNVNDSHKGSYTYYRVQVVDVTSGQHGVSSDGTYTDSRFSVPGLVMRGVGRGWISVLVDSTGKPQGWGFSRTPYANSIHWQDVDPIAFGRLILPNQPPVP